MDNKFSFTVVTDSAGRIIKVTEASFMGKVDVVHCHPDFKFLVEVNRLKLNIKILKFFKKYSKELFNQTV